MDRGNEEAELVARICQGDKAALEQLYLRYVDRLYSLVFHQVAQNKSTAEEIVHDTFTSALNSIEKYRGESKFYTWLCSIAHHKVTDFYRRQARHLRRGQLSIGISAIESEQIREREQPVYGRAENEERRQLVEKAILSLPLDYRQVLMYKYVEEMPVSEISQVMHRSPRSVEGLLARARQKLWFRVEELGERF